MDSCLNTRDCVPEGIWTCSVSEVDLLNTSVVINSNQKYSSFKEYLNLLHGVVLFRSDTRIIPMLVFYVMPSSYFKNWEFLRATDYEIAIEPQQNAAHSIAMTGGKDHMMRIAFTAFGNKCVVTDLKFDGTYIRLNNMSVDNRNMQLPTLLIEGLVEE